MVKLIEMMLDEHLITKEAISALVKSRPPKRVSFSNLIHEKMIDLHTVESYLAKNIRQGVITLDSLEKIEGIDVVPILELVAKELHIQYVDLDDIELDMQLFSKVPYRQLLRYNAMPVEETDLNILVAFADALDMAARDALQRIFPRKPIIIAIAKPSQIRMRLQQLEMTESIKGLVDDIRQDLIQAGSDEQDEESPAVLKLIEIILKSAIVLQRGHNL